jgi:putative membrane protein
VIEWKWEPSVMLGSLLLVGGYLICVGPRRSRFPGASEVAGWRIGAFLLGVGVMFLALATPLDQLSDQYLLSAHMVQHMLLTLAMPPLLLLGTPGWLMRPVLRSWLMAGLARFVTRPLVAYLAFNLTIALSHLPLIYNFTLQNHNAHIALHLAYMATAVVAWWPILSQMPELSRLAYPLQMLYLFLQTIPGALVGSLITLAGDVLYPTYAAAPRLWGLTPLADQQLGGMIMWLGVSTYIFIIMTVIFFVWAHREEVRPLIPSPRGRG